eukprot:SAG11_NODE_743_length_7407_cov_2.941434_1_plen_132_part_00
MLRQNEDEVAVAPTSGPASGGFGFSVGLGGADGQVRKIVEMTDRNAHENEFKAALRRQAHEADDDKEEDEGAEKKGMSSMAERLQSLNIIPDEVKMPSDIVRRTAKGQKRRGSVAATQVHAVAIDLCRVCV